jgi:hypothetical protein
MFEIELDAEIKAHMPCHGVQVLIRQKNGRRRRSACKKGKKEENNKKKEILYEKGSDNR